MGYQPLQTRMSLTPQPGTLIDNRFTILEPLGEGGMGSVFKARQLGLERIVALKMLHSQSLADHESRMRFEREGKVLSKLSHPNLPTFYHFGTWNGTTPYMAFEFLSGRSLRELLEERGRLDWREAVKIAVRVCDALSAVHHRGIVHRDIKPNNIMILSDDTVKLVDFGLVTSQDQVLTLTRTGALIGSLFYMSPEQCKGTKVDARADIYSLSCVIFEAISGAPPLVADNPISLIRKHISEDPISLEKSAGDPQIPPELSACLAQGLSKSQSHRQQSIEQFRFQLTRILDEQELVSEGVTEQPLERLSARPGNRKERIIQSLCALACICAAIGIASVERALGRNQVSGADWQSVYKKVMGSTSNSPSALLGLLKLMKQAGRSVPPDQIERVYVLTAQRFIDEGYPLKGIEVVRDAEELFSRWKDTSWLAKAKSFEAHFLQTLSDTDTAKNIYREVIELNASDEDQVAKAYYALATIAQSQAELPLCIKYLKSAMQHFRHLNQSDGVLTCLAQLHLVACEQGNRHAIDDYRKDLLHYASSVHSDEDLKALVRAGNQLFRSGFVNEAMKIFDESRQVYLTVQNTTIREQLVDELIKAHVGIELSINNSKRALELCKEMSQYDHLPSAKWWLAASFFRNGDYLDAESLLGKVLEVSQTAGQKTNALILMAQIADERGRSSYADAICQNLRDSDLSAPTLREILLANLSLIPARKQLQRIQLLNRAITLAQLRNDVWAEALFRGRKASTTLQTADLNATVAAVERATQQRQLRNTNSVTNVQACDILISTGNRLVGEDRLEEAMPMFTKALCYCRYNKSLTAQCWRDMGEIHLRQGNFEEARLAANKVAKLATHDLSGLQTACWSAQLFQLIGDEDSAAKILDKFEELTSRLSASFKQHASLICQVEIVRVNILKNTGMYSEALAHADRCLEASQLGGTDVLEAQLIRADLLGKLGQKDKFEALIPEIRKNSADRNAVTDNRLAAMEYALGDRARAKELMAPVVEACRRGSFEPRQRMNFICTAIRIYEDEPQAALDLANQAILLRLANPQWANCPLGNLETLKQTYLAKLASLDH